MVTVAAGGGPAAPAAMPSLDRPGFRAWGGETAQGRLGGEAVSSSPMGRGFCFIQGVSFRAWMDFCMPAPSDPIAMSSGSCALLVGPGPKPHPTCLADMRPKSNSAGSCSAWAAWPSIPDDHRAAFPACLLSSSRPLAHHGAVHRVIVPVGHAHLPGGKARRMHMHRLD